MEHLYANNRYLLLLINFSSNKTLRCDTEEKLQNKISLRDITLNEGNQFPIKKVLYPQESRITYKNPLKSSATIPISQFLRMIPLEFSRRIK